MSSTNQQLAVMFAQMAAITEITGGDRFRVNAFAKAARILEEMGEDVQAIGPDIKALAAVEGIGKGTAERIAAFLRTGRMDDYEQLKAKVPAGLLELLDVQGLGPKKVALLWKEAGVTSLADLKAKLAGDELAQLPGMGAKTLENLRKSIVFAEQSGGRVRIGQVMPLALYMLQQLGQVEGVQQVNYAGSLRRGKETIGDLDLIVAAKSSDAPSIMQAFTGLEPVTQVLVSGTTKSSVRTVSGVQVDLRIVEPHQYGAALLYFTGSKEHNVALRERALKQGMTLNEYALSQLESKQVVVSDSEEGIYQKLGLSYIPPELREDRGELALAEKGELPRLVERDDIGAELHAHTTASDGALSIRELVSVAIERGYHTLAITDHSRSQFQANGLDEARLEKHIEAVRDVAREVKSQITVLAGSEVDILSDGRLDYTNSVLKELDIVIASPHSALSQDTKTATKRLLKAIEHPHVTIIGHMTGRLINRRPGLSPDVKALCKAAAQRGIALEINANHYRLDLRDTHVRLALEHGVKLAINTDAHGSGDFDELRYGVLTARRGGATRDDVINCLDREALMRWIQQTRKA